MPDSYLVIGGSGLLGSHIVDRLVKRGEERVALFDLTLGTSEHYSGVRQFVGDICIREDLEKAVREVSRMYSRFTPHVHSTD